MTTGDGWSSVAKQQMDAKDENKFDRGIGFFFISIVLVCGIAMLVALFCYVSRSLSAFFISIVLVCGVYTYM